MSQWVVLKFFNVRNSCDKIVSIHDTKDCALDWARRYCFLEHGEIIDVTYTDGLCGHDTDSYAYGPTDTYMSWIYHVKRVPYRGSDTPPPLSRAHEREQEEDVEIVQGDAVVEDEGEGEEEKKE